VEPLEQQKLDAMKELAYGASHEINNPLANIAARAQSLLREESHPERRRALEAIHQQAMRAHEMISDLMLFARPPQLEFEEFNLSELLEEITDHLGEECSRRRIEITRDSTDESLTITADRQQIAVALGAVCRNAIEAVGQDGSVQIVVDRRQSAAGDRVVIEISDTGPGISAEVRRHLFDPFYSGREAGRGLGFGLSKCWRIITEHGGTIAVDSSSARGATISIDLAARPD